MRNQARKPQALGLQVAEKQEMGEQRAQLISREAK